MFSSSGVCLAEGLSRFHKEALTLEVLLAKLGVVSLPNSVILTEYLATLGIEAFALHVFFAKRAVEALRVVVVVDRLHPAVSRLDRETTGDALCCEQFVPIFFTVR